MSLGPFGAASVKTEHLDNESDVLCQRLQNAAGNYTKSGNFGDYSDFIWRLAEVCIYNAKMLSRIAEYLEKSPNGSN